MMCAVYLWAVLCVNGGVGATIWCWACTSVCTCACCVRAATYTYCSLRADYYMYTWCNLILIAHTTYNVKGVYVVCGVFVSRGVCWWWCMRKHMVVRRYSSWVLHVVTACCRGCEGVNVYILARKLCVQDPEVRTQFYLCTGPGSTNTRRTQVDEQGCIIFTGCTTGRIYLWPTAQILGIWSFA